MDKYKECFVKGVRYDQDCTKCPYLKFCYKEAIKHGRKETPKGHT